MKAFFDILRGVVIGLANIIPWRERRHDDGFDGHLRHASSAASTRCSRTSNAASKRCGRMRWAWYWAFSVWPS